jgi:hypothetical protein
MPRHAASSKDVFSFNLTDCVSGIDMSSAHVPNALSNAPFQTQTLSPILLTSTPSPTSLIMPPPSE